MIQKIKNFIFRQYLNAKPNAQYRFLVGKIQSTMDIDLMAAVIEAGFFRKNLVPLPIKLDSLKRIAVFAPHQDDEVIGCGGLLIRLAQLGCEIHLVFLTDGRPGGPNWQESVKVRSSEVEIVASKLNAKIYEIGIDNISLIPTNYQWDQLKIIANTSFDAIFTPWALDSPPKHRLCNFLLKNVLKSNNTSLDVFSYQVHSALIPNVYFDYSQFFEAKQDLINIYKSQMITQNYAHISAGLDAWTSRYLHWSDKQRYIEAYTQLPLEEWRKWIQLYEKYPEQAFRGDSYCLDAFTKIKSLFD